MERRIVLTTLGLEFASDGHADGCPILSGWRDAYSPAFNQIIQENFEIVEGERADGFILPSNVSFYTPKRLREIGKIVSRLDMPSIAFDISNERPKPDWLDYIIRFSWYGSQREKGSIISPAFLGSDGFDLIAEQGLTDWQPLDKPPKPTVGFCGREGGKAGLAIWKILPRSLTRWMATDYFCGTTRGIRMVCCYPLRVDSIQVLQNDPRIEMNWVRRGQVGMQPTAQGEMRRQFLDNLNNNAYALCVRGTDNYSWRFYEVLSVGKIPLLIDTDCILPLEESIDWDRYILRVPATQLEELPERLLEWHSRFSNEAFHQLQRDLRGLFEQLLPGPYYVGLFSQIFRDRLNASPK